MVPDLSTCMDQCRERLEKEIAEAAPPNSRVKVTSPANAIERRFSVWIGAAGAQCCLLASCLALSVRLAASCEKQHAWGVLCNAHVSATHHDNMVIMCHESVRHVGPGPVVAGVHADTACWQAFH